MMFGSGPVLRSNMLFHRTMMLHVVMLFGRQMVCRGNMMLRVGTRFSSRRLFRGRMLPGRGDFFRSEMLRVPVVRGPKTFGKTIFHANSLSESPDAHASPTQVIRPRIALEIVEPGARPAESVLSVLSAKSGASVHKCRLEKCLSQSLARPVCPLRRTLPQSAGVVMKPPLKGAA
jgi:hypothetical protein